VGLHGILNSFRKEVVSEGDVMACTVREEVFSEGDVKEVTLKMTFS
jgi:hypothetical protein